LIGGTEMDSAALPQTNDLPLPVQILEPTIVTDGNSDDLNELPPNPPVQSINIHEKKRKFENSDSDVEAKRKKCFRCGGHGHIQQECSSTNFSDETTIVCYKCNGKGHFARNCPNIRNDVCYVCHALGHHSLDCPSNDHRKGPPATMASGVNLYNFGNGYSMQNYSGYHTRGYTDETYFSDGTAAGYDDQTGQYNPYNHQLYNPYPSSSSLPDMKNMFQPTNDEGIIGLNNNISPSYPREMLASTYCCWKCGESGHIARCCPNAAYFDTQVRPKNDYCFRCGQTGHIARECNNAPNLSFSRTMEACFRCGDTGHYFRDCNRNGAVANRQACFKCGQLGHQSRNCAGQDIRVCFYCRQPGHVAKDCKQAPSAPS